MKPRKQIITQHKQLNLQNPEVVIKQRLKEKDSEINELRKDNEELHQVLERYKLNDIYVRALIHELKNINRDLKFDTDDLNFDGMSADEKNLWSQSNLLSIVMNTYGFQYNQEPDSSVFKRPIPLFKKVDKLRKCYSFRRNSDFNISISGASKKSFISTDIIEVLFFILIENARKYSLKGEKLFVHFKEYGSTVEVTFKNMCVLPSTEDLPHLTEMEYRGKNQTRDGKGIGLATFASICETFNIEYDISISENGTGINRQPIGFFKVELIFRNCV